MQNAILNNTSVKFSFKLLLSLYGVCGLLSVAVKRINKTICSMRTE